MSKPISNVSSIRSAWCRNNRASEFSSWERIRTSPLPCCTSSGTQVCIWPTSSARLSAKANKKLLFTRRVKSSNIPTNNSIWKSLRFDIELLVGIFDGFTRRVNSNFLFAFALRRAEEVGQMQSCVPELVQQGSGEVRIRSQLENSLARLFRHQAERIDETFEIGFDISLQLFDRPI